MRKQTKIAAVVSAAALLAMGASITSFAASKGTWMMVDGEWYCYDSDGDVYENKFCLSNGKEYYVGDDGRLVRSEWVEDDGDYFFVNSSGQKITNDWRLTTPYDDDGEEEQWFYFKSNGKRAEDEKLLIKGKTYFFDSNGEMLTGWVQKSGDGWDEASSDEIKGANSETYYCNEDGARIEKDWVYDYAPGVDEDDATSDDEMHWYYLKSSGKAATGKQSNVNGQTYFFNNQGEMLTGWVGQTGSNGYELIWEDDDDTDGTFDTALNAFEEGDVHFCGPEDDGHMKKNKWVKVWSNTQYGEDDDDNDAYWYWIDKSGDVYIPSKTASYSNAVRLKLSDGEADYNADRWEEDNYDDDNAYGTCEAEIDGSYWGISDDDAKVKMYEKKINSKTYYFNEFGQMLSKFMLTVDENGNGEKLYYLGGWDDGARKDGSQSIKDESGESIRFYFATETKADQGYYNAAGISGAKSGKLYDHGILVEAKDDKYEEKTVKISINNKPEKEYTFIVNKNGSIQGAKKEYEEDDDVLIDARNYEFCKTKGALYNSIVLDAEDEDAE